MEAVPQVHIMLILWGFLGRKLTGSIEGPDSIRSIDQEGAFFLATFISSVFSASKGIAGFLLHGPCKLVPTDGLFGGMGKLGFILLLLNIASTLCGKGVLLGFLFTHSGVSMSGMLMATSLRYWRLQNNVTSSIWGRTSSKYCNSLG